MRQACRCLYYSIILLIFLAGCQNPTDKDFVVETESQEIISQLEPNAYTSLEISDRGSHITFRCRAQWNGDPLDPRAPKALLSKTCVGDRCVKNNLGSVSELTIWAQDFNLIEENETAYCLAYMPSWFILEGLPPNQTVSEWHYEKFVLSTKYNLRTYWVEVPDNFRDYCLQVECNHDGCECTNWQ